MLLFLTIKSILNIKIYPKIPQPVINHLDIISFVQFSRNGNVGHILIDKETMFRGVGELFRVLLPPFNNWCCQWTQTPGKFDPFESHRR